MTATLIETPGARALKAEFVSSDPPVLCLTDNRQGYISWTIDLLGGVFSERADSDQLAYSPKRNSVKRLPDWNDKTEQYIFKVERDSDAVMVISVDDKMYYYSINDSELVIEE